MEVKYVKGLAVNPQYQKNKLAAMEYRPQDGDIILLSHMKTGSTWLQYIVMQIISKGLSYPSINEAVNNIVPLLGYVDIQVIENLCKPRAYRTHIPIHMLQTNKNAKYLYIHRNPKDVLVSFYHMQKQMDYGEEDFDKFFQQFVNGNVWYGDYFDHVLSFYHHRNDTNALFLSYEKMMENTRETVLKIAHFLGESYYDDLLDSDGALLEKILTVTSFDHMKKNLELKVPVGGNEETNINFFRKGIIGDGKSVLSEDQSEILLRKTLEKVVGTELKELWIPYY